MFRQWLGERLMAFAVKLLDVEKIVREVEQEKPREDEEDWDVAVHPAVTLGPKALAMLEFARMPAPPAKRKTVVPLRGSLQDRIERARALRR